MIVKFYKKKYKDGKSYVLIAEKYLDVVPQKGTLVKIHGQIFCVETILFDAEECNYKICCRRARA